MLRGLNELWSARQTESNLAELAGEIGSDPPFFVVGATLNAGAALLWIAARPDRPIEISRNPSLSPGM